MKNAVISEESAVTAKIKEAALNYGADQHKIFTQELAAMKKQVTDRSEWMQNNIDTFEGFEVKDELQYVDFIFTLTLPIILTLLTVGYWIYYLVTPSFKDFDYLVPTYFRGFGTRYKLLETEIPNRIRVDIE